MFLAMPCENHVHRIQGVQMIFRKIGGGYLLRVAPELSEHEIDLQTPLRKNMIDTRPKSFVRHTCRRNALSKQ